MVEGYTFPKKEKLLKTSDFKLVYSRGRAYYSPAFTLYLLNVQGDERRIGFVVSKKNARKAVKRNKIKRQLREVYRLNKNRIASGINLIIIAKKQAAELNFHQIEAEIIRLWKRAKVWTKDKQNSLSCPTCQTDEKYKVNNL